jgi:hypothetical protein
MNDDDFRPSRLFKAPPGTAIKPGVMTNSSRRASRPVLIRVVWLGLLCCVVTLTIFIAIMCVAPSADGSPVLDASRCPMTSFRPPELVHAKDPRDFGARCDGVTDDTDAFQKAMDAGDVKVAAGTCLINKTVTVRISNRHMECAPGTLLKRTVSDAESMFVYQAGNGALIGDSIVNCNFEGANSPDPVVDWDAPGHWDIPVKTTDNVSNFLLAGNTFKQFFGQSMFQTTGANGGSGDRIIFNTFKSCPLYGPVFVGHLNGYVGYNKIIGCTAGVENDHAEDHTGGNIFECNTVTSNAAPGYITGGVYGVNTNYSGNIVRYNAISGYKTGILKEHQEGGRNAQYIGNSCTGGCNTR